MQRGLGAEPAMGQGELPQPCLPLPRTSTVWGHGTAHGTPTRSLRGERRKQLGGPRGCTPTRLLSLGQREHALQPAHAGRRVHTGACSCVYLQAWVHLHPLTHTCTCAHTQPLPDRTRAPRRATGPPNPMRSCAQAAVGRRRQPRLWLKVGGPSAQGHGGAPEVPDPVG